MSEMNLVKDICRSFREVGGKSFLVGGCVRDRIMRIEPKDYDLEVYGVPAEKIEPLLRRFGLVNVIGKSFCIYRLQHPRIQEVHIDVSIPRKDSKAGSGHKGFIVSGDPSMSIEEATRRRDVTVNSILEDPLTGQWHDPFGGKKDIENKVLRATDERLFGEDPLRVLRVCQFAARFNFSVHPQTVRICREIAHTLAELSRERIGEEWKKLLLKGTRPSVGLKAVYDLGVTEVLHPELHALMGVPQEPEWHPEGDVWTHTLMVVDCASKIIQREKVEGDSAYAVMLGALCHDFGKPATTAKDTETGRIRSLNHSEAGLKPASRFLKTLKVSEDIEKKVKNITLEHLNPLYLYHHRQIIKPSTVKRLAVRLFPASFEELIFVAEADYMGRSLDLPDYPAGEWLREQLRVMELQSGGPAPVLMGRHLIDRGWSPGKKMGKILKEIYEMQIEGTVTDLESALKQAETLKSRNSV